MAPVSRSQSGDTATDIILSTFRANGLLLEAGDRISGSYGLTSARWQVLGAVSLADRALTVPQIARRMGLTRQSVHATVDRLVRDELLERTPNDDHRSSQLIDLTERGRRTYGALDRDQGAWIDDLTRGLPSTDLETTKAVLDELVRRLEANRTMEPPPRQAHVSAGTEG